MMFDKIVKRVKWFKNHLLQIFIVVFILTILFLIFLDNFGRKINLNKIISESEPVINIIMWISGIGGVIVLYGDFLAQKQHEAVFGFYANMRFFLTRLKVFLGKDFSQCAIFVKLYTETAFNSNSSINPTKEHIDAFRSLCLEFIDFLSNSKDNIPLKREGDDFVQWYQKQIKIVELLQKGAFFTVDSFGDFSNIDDLMSFYDDIKNNVKYFDKIIEDKIIEDSLL